MIILNSPTPRFFTHVSTIPQEVLQEMPPFFLKEQYVEVVSKFFHFSPGGHPHQHFTPRMRANTGKIRYFEKWRDFEEKVERQGKDYQIVCNEPINAHLSL